MSGAETTLAVPQGQFQLYRFPRRKGEPLRAWDAADVYLLQHLHEEPLAECDDTWIVNDSFGALTVALAGGQRFSMASDSWLAHEGTRANLLDNARSSEKVRLVTSLESPPPVVGAVLLKIPKSLALLEDQLRRLRGHLPEGVRILGAGMSKTIHTSTLRLFECILGPTTTTLARGKARLVMCQFDKDLDPGPNPFPTQYYLEGTDWTLSSHAGVFCRERLDVGTRHLLEHIPASDSAQDIVDLGCGNGVVGLVAAQRNAQARVTFVDESYMAVASARHNWQAQLGDTRPAVFEVGDCLAPITTDSVDLILCNPPFHQHNAMGDTTAWRMFAEARRVLRSGGELLVVGNRHLAYHAKLRRLFGNCDVVDSDRRFVVLRSRSNRSEGDD
ncbi:MAG: methyltransferase [Candidatus Latescibacterota bacterium]